MIRHAPSIGLGLGISLRSDTLGSPGLLDLYPGAAAAYSLRALSAGWLAGDVVEVRPSSGWTPASFTANQVANGELVDYVKRPGDFTNIGFTTFANNGTGDGFTATLTSGTGQAQSSTVPGVASDTVTVDFDITIVSGSPLLSLRSGAGIPQDPQVISTSGSYSITLTATGNFSNFTFSEGDIPSEFTVSNVRVSTNDGFVSTWYDQSGNANNATQATTTSQPKIVDAGALVTGGLDFDGVDDSLGLTGLSLTSTGWSSFVKWNADSFATDMAILRCRPLGAIPSVAGVIPIETDGAQFSQNISNDDSVEAIAINLSAFGTLSTATDYLNTTILTSTAVDLWTNGTQETYTNTLLGGTTIPISTVGVSQIYIGTADGTARPFNGKICEVILYDSDQTANREAIESLI